MPATVKCEWTIETPSGEPIPHAEIQVTTDDIARSDAVVYSDEEGETPIEGQIRATEASYVEFYLKPGIYFIYASSGVLQAQRTFMAHIGSIFPEVSP